MKAALDIVLFIATVYEYFFPRNGVSANDHSDEPQPDI